MRGECIYCVKEVVNNNKKWIFYSQADLKFGPPLFFYGFLRQQKIEAIQDDELHLDPI